MNTRTDPRVRRTRRILCGALVSLSLEKDYASISIKEITDRAEVAYITFFGHYNGIDELLMEALDDGLVELIHHIETLAVKSEDPAVETEGKLIFEYINKNSNPFQILLKGQSVARIHKSVVKNISTVFQNSCRPLRRSNSQIPASIAGNHIATSLLAWIEWWLENQTSPPSRANGKNLQGCNDWRGRLCIVNIETECLTVTNDDRYPVIIVKGANGKLEEVQFPRPRDGLGAIAHV